MHLLISKNLLKYSPKPAVQEHPSASKCPLHLPVWSSYQHQWRLPGIMLHAVVFWQSILVQVSLAPGGPQALVRAAHLTHGRVAHGAGFKVYPIST